MLILFKIFVVYALCFAMVNLTYEFPITALDASVVLFAIGIFMILRTIRLESFKGFLALVIVGVLICGINLMPIVYAGIQETKVKVEQIQISNIKYYSKNHIKNFSELYPLARAYYKDFMLKDFYMIFFAVLFMVEALAKREEYRVCIGKQE